MHDDMKQLITLREAADRLEVHVSTIRAWVRDGRLPAYRLGTRFTRVSWREVLATLERGEVRAGEEGSALATESEEGEFPAEDQQ